MAACPSCAAENRETARFCDRCGAPLAVAAEQHEQRKTVTALFADVTGSTALGERLDAESFRRVMARYFDEARRVIERHGGTVEKFIGDAVMAVFGVPAVHEDDAVRAVRAASELQTAIRELNVELERDYGTTLELRTGINTGEVVTGTKERLATGDAVNVAARLQQAAAPGEILLGAETRALARDAVTVEKVEALELRGKHERIAAWRLVAVERDAPGVARRLDATMVGRAHELTLLEDAFANAVRRSTCSLFTLLGTAGVGKSRLVREFLTSVDATVVQGHCLSYGEGITYWPVVEIVKQLLPARHALAEESDGAEDVLAALLGESDLPTTAEQIAWAVRKLFEAAARMRPLVVVFDDIHWGEPAFLDLVEHVADLSRDAPILLACLARPELLDRRAGWGGGKLNATAILLEPLDAGETAELIDRLLGGEELEAGLAERIRIAAEGNPLYVEEMLAMVRESGEHEVTVPPTIKALLAARLDQLDASERAVLERGSVEGQLFHSAAVVALARQSQSIEPQLVSLVRKELVRPDRPQLPSTDAYRFRHILIRDAAYDALPKATRAELHERFARWLEHAGALLVERDEIVGYHLEQAYRYRIELGPADAATEALAQQAAELLATAARTARLHGDVHAAVLLLGRALELDGRERPELRAELAELLLEVGELKRAIALLDEAREIARAGGDEGSEAVAAVWRAVLSGHVGDSSASFDDTIRLAERAVEVLEREGDAAAVASMLFVLGQHHFFTGQAREAERVLARALDLALGTGDLFRARECVVWSFGAKTFGAASLTEIDTALAEIPEILQAGLVHTPLHHMHQALTYGYGGRFEEARLHCREASRMAAELGMRIHGAGTTMFAGLVELAAGDAHKAEQDLRDGFDRLGEVGEAGFRSTVGGLLAEALVRLDRNDEAAQVLDIVDAIAQLDDVDPQVRSRSVRAKILARRGQRAEAERLAREAVEIAARTDYLVLHADALLALGGARGEGRAIGGPREPPQPPRAKGERRPGRADARATCGACSCLSLRSTRPRMASLRHE